MSEPDSSARILQSTTTAPFLASQKNESQTEKHVTSYVPLASQKLEEKQGEQATPMAGQKKQTLASQKREKQTVKIKASQGTGQKSKTVKINGLTFRVRLSDRGYRVMLLTVEAGRQHEPYLVSLRRSEWQAVENDEVAFLAKVKEKLGQRIGKAPDEEKNKVNLLVEKLNAVAQPKP